MIRKVLRVVWRSTQLAQVVTVHSSLKSGKYAGNFSKQRIKENERGPVYYCQVEQELVGCSCSCNEHVQTKANYCVESPCIPTV